MRSPLKDEIAAKAGINPDQMIAISPAQASPAPGTQVTAPDTSNPNIRVLRATVPTLQNGQVPMISVQTQAPSADEAAKLANAAIEVLQKHLQSVAATDRVPAERQLVVRQLGPGRAVVSTRGPGKKMAAIAVIPIFGAGCGTILLLVALIGGWKEASELERNPRPRPV